MIFIREYEMTDRQKEWHRAAPRDERDTFFLSAPVRIAAQSFADLTSGHEGYQYLPTIHGIPVVGKDRTWYDDPEEAQAFGEQWQTDCRERLAGRIVPLDIAALGIAGKQVAEYATPGGQEEAFFAEFETLLGGRTNTTSQA
jgi:hypothetical protein